ncbi:uncharacterized protein LOC116929087 isoform X2 [Daphnia magna]|uniref:uncharacterized protein LOC116929087 isoform X2 n=1 Tax=Daphnia magna TaxID=35525 RepID=UPI001E1BD922|nr:uncharacterized protein LOC116929087 isoform X2 [Daphnia magna]
MSVSNENAGGNSRLDYTAQEEQLWPLFSLLLVQRIVRFVMDEHNTEDTINPLPRPLPFFVSCVGCILLYHSSSFFTHSEECQPFVACCTSTMMIYLHHIGQGNPGNEETAWEKNVSIGPWSKQIKKETSWKDLYLSSCQLALIYFPFLSAFLYVCTNNKEQHRKTNTGLPRTQ